MTGSFRIIHASPDSLTLKVGPHDLEGDAGELLEFVASAVGSGQVSSITLDAAEAGVVTLESVGVLIRLREQAGEAHADFRIAPSNPRLDRKLAETGTLGLFASRP
jgi:hypothetical protein